MQLRTLAHDCLYVNWALPRESAPELPAPLRYEAHKWNDREWVFASALLYRLADLHLAALRFARVSYPQMNLRLYVLDDEDIPSAFFLRVLVPLWVAPMSRFLSRQPATAASFSYPSPSSSPGEESWTWTVERSHRLELSARMASPHLGHGPDLGPWDQAVAYFRNRRRGYAMGDNRLHTIRTSPDAAVAIWPMAAEPGDVSLLCECFTGADEEVWKTPHSAWLAPEIPLNFELGKTISLPLPASGGVPATEGC